MACVNRREFLAAAAGMVVVTGAEERAAASERVRVAVIGTHGRGADHAQMFASNPLSV
jgi:hypothetical protein